MQQNTSSLAYARSLPKHGTHRRLVYEVIKYAGTITDHQISFVTQFKINKITPRRNELVKENLVEKAFEALDEMTNTKAIYWKIKD